MAAELLALSRNTLVTKRLSLMSMIPPTKMPRIGVFVCHCGNNIASVVDVEKVKNEVAKEPGVIFAQDTMFTCSSPSLNNIRDMIHQHRLNRIVVASCTPRTHEPIFRDTLREAGLNQYLFELANIRDQCSWVHSNGAGSRHAKSHRARENVYRAGAPLKTAAGLFVRRQSDGAGHRRRRQRHDRRFSPGRPGLQDCINRKNRETRRQFCEYSLYAGAQRGQRFPCRT